MITSISKLLNHGNDVKKFHPSIFYRSRKIHVSSNSCLTDKRTNIWNYREATELKIIRIDGKKNVKYCLSYNKHKKLWWCNCSVTIFLKVNIFYLWSSNTSILFGILIDLKYLDNLSSTYAVLICNNVSGFTPSN